MADAKTLAQRLAALDPGIRNRLLNSAQSSSTSSGGLDPWLSNAMARGAVTPPTTSPSSQPTPSPSGSPSGGSSTPFSPVTNSIIPDPGTYEEETAQALQAYNQALSAIGARRANTLQSYGFTAHVDPTTGALSSYAIDPNNQYGALQQLMGSQGLGQHQLEESSVARGLGAGPGLAAQNLAALRMAQGGQTMALGSQFLGDINSEAMDQQNALNAYGNAQIQAQRDAIAAAISGGNFTPVPMSNNTVPQTAAAPGVTTTQTGTVSNNIIKNPNAPKKTQAPGQLQPGRMPGGGM